MISSGSDLNLSNTDKNANEIELNSLEKIDLDDFDISAIEKIDFECSLVKKEGLNRVLSFVVPVDFFNKVYYNKLEYCRSSYFVNGFRKGKVPLDIIQSIKGEEIYKDSLSYFVDKSMNDVFINFKAMKDIKVAKLNFSKEIGLTFCLDFNIRPEVPSIDVSAINLTKYLPKIEDEDIDSEFSKYLFYKDSNNSKVEDGDFIVIDYNFISSDKKSKKEYFNDVRIKVGSQSLINGIEDIIIGKEVGFKTNFEYKPVDSIVFSIKYNISLKRILKPSIECSKEDIVSFYNFKSHDDMKLYIKNKIQDKYNSISFNICKKDLIKILCDSYIFEVPKSLLKSEDDFERMKVSMLINKFSKDNSISVSDEELNSYISNIVFSNPSLFRELFEESSSRGVDFIKNSHAIFYSIILENKVMDKIISLCNINEVFLSISEFDKIDS